MPARAHSIFWALQKNEKIQLYAPQVLLYVCWLNCIRFFVLTYVNIFVEEKNFPLLSLRALETIIIITAWRIINSSGSSSTHPVLFCISSNYRANVRNTKQQFASIPRHPDWWKACVINLNPCQVLTRLNQPEFILLTTLIVTRHSKALDDWLGQIFSPFFSSPFFNEFHICLRVAFCHTKLNSRRKNWELAGGRKWSFHFKQFISYVTFSTFLNPNSILPFAFPIVIARFLNMLLNDL